MVSVTMLTTDMNTSENALMERRYAEEMNDRQEEIRLPGEEELEGRLRWLIRLRWLSAISVLALAWIAPLLTDTRPDRYVLSFIGAAIIVYNIMFSAMLKTRITAGIKRRRVFASLQLILDWLALAVLIYVTGGVDSPFLYFFIFHGVFAALLLPPLTAYVHVVFGAILVNGLAILEFWGVIPHIAVEGYRAGAYNQPSFVAATLMVFDILLFLLVMFVSSTARRLHRRTRELAEARERMEQSVSKTRAVLEIARTIGATLDVEREMDAIVKAAVAAVGAKAASLRVLDPQGVTLELNASVGLSQEYLEKGSVSALRGTIDRRVLDGEVVVISDVASEPGFQYPEAAIREGLKSAVCVPLVLPERMPGEPGPGEPPLGVLRVYTGEPHVFTEEEIGFLKALASQGAVALANARAYDQLRKLESSRARFVFAVAHQLKSPVGVMQGKLEMLQEGYVGDLTKEQREAISVALRRLAGLQALIRDLLTLAALDGQSVQRVSTDVDPRTIVSKVVEQMRPDAMAKGVEIRAEASEDVPVIRTNPADFELVVANLVENAIKYTPPAGEVRVLLERDEGKLCMTVADTGMGIAKEDLPRVFEEFFRAHGAVKESGTGLGLSLVRRIVDLYRGTIAVESECGKGTTFTVRWPAAE